MGHGRWCRHGGRGHRLGDDSLGEDNLGRHRLGHHRLGHHLRGDVLGRVVLSQVGCLLGLLGVLVGHCQAFFSATSTVRMLMGCTGAVFPLASAGVAPAAAILSTIPIPEVTLPKIE